MSDWLTAEECRERYDLPMSNLDRWRKHGCPLFGGRRLRAKRVRRQGGGPGHRHLFWGPEIRKLGEAPCWDGVYKDVAGTWYSTRKAEQHYGYSVTRLYGWRKRCPYLPAGKLRAQLVSVVERAGSKRWCRPRWVWNVKDLSQISGGVPKDSQWLSTAEVIDRYGFGRMTLYNWRVEGCPHLGGRTLRSGIRRLDIHKDGGTKRSHVAAARVRVYHAGDLEEVVRNRKVSPEASAEPGWLTYRETWQQFGFPYHQLRYWSLTRCRHLDGRKLATKSVRAGVGHCVMETTKYARADLEEIARRRASKQARNGVAPSSADLLRDFDQAKGGGVNTDNPLVLPHRLESVSGQAAETLAEHIWRAKPKDADPVIPSAIDRMRAAIATKGATALPDTLIREVGIERGAGRAALRELERLGEYRGFTRKRPGRYKRR